jgi:hypothetical protein
MNETLKELIEDILYNTLETDYGTITSGSIRTAVENICDIVETLNKIK